MAANSLVSHLQIRLATCLGRPVTGLEMTPVGGGSINQACRLLVNRCEPLFCKLNSARRFPGLFEKEKNGLELLAARDIIRVPRVILCDIIEDRQVLVLEWMEPGVKTGLFWQDFGSRLAALHQVSNPVCGLQEDNYMGALPQRNNQMDSWPEFFIQQRLRPQVQMAFDRQLLAQKHLQQFETFYRQAPELFPPRPAALLHGDLWSGNFLCAAAEQPVLIDPAVYYGHPAMDLAMTTLFGGFDPSFYEAYFYHSPQPGNYRLQWDACNLYPLLVHLNLFGSGYLHDIEGILKQFL